MASLTHILDHIDRAKARLMSIFQGKTLLDYVIDAWGGEVQAFEDALIDVANCYDIDEAEGYNLDTLGMIIVGGKRGDARGNSADDAEFRLRLKAHVRARLSKGRAEDVYRVFAVMIAATQNAKAHRQETASIEYEIIGSATTAILAAILLRFLRLSLAGNQYGVLSWSLQAQADTFCFNQSSATIATELTAGAAAAATSIAVDSTIGFASSGRLTISPGTGAEMDLAYTSKTGTTFAVSPLLFAVNLGDVVAQSTAIGKYLVPQSVTTVNIVALDTTITVASTAAFPSAGYIDVTRADGTLESTYQYTGKNATQFTGISPIAQTFVAGAEVLGQDGGVLAASKAA